MKIKNARKWTICIVTTVIVLMSAAFTFAAEYGAGTTLYEDIKDLGDGLTYTHTILYNSTYGREESYQMQTTLGESIKPIVIACDTIYGGMTISKVIDYAKTLGYNVLGAINTDFFSTDTRVPLGVVVEDGVYKSSGDGYPSVSFDADGRATINSYTLVNITLKNNGGAPDADNSGQEVTFTHFNKMRQNGGGLYLFDENFSTVSTRTSSQGWFIKMKILEGTMSTEGTMELEVVERIDTSGAIPIEKGYMYLTADETSFLQWRSETFAVGDKITLTTTCDEKCQALATCQWATGGGDILIKDGLITDPTKWNKSVTGKNPRTALGIKADGSIIYYTIDGRRKSYSNGLTMDQLANELYEQGCVDAINFDGGGSTAIALKLPGYGWSQLLNSPSDGSMRKCATYILLVNEKYSDGMPQLLHLAQDGTIMYKGASLGLTYLATDSGTATVADSSLPTDITAMVTSGRGTVEGNVYTAGDTAGTETLTLTSESTGLTGTGSIFVVDRLSSIDVSVSGTTLTTLTVERGDTVQFDASALYEGENVVIDSDEFSYTASESLGSISSNGLFTVKDDAIGTGYVQVSAGGVTQTVWITVASAFSDIQGHWAESYITDLYTRGIVTGSGDGLYSPYSDIKRGDFILMLYRANGAPATTGGSGFTDVDDSAYYASAIGWAKANGIAMGDGGAFHADDGLTREQAFTFIYRYLAYSGADITEGDASTLAAFSDASSVHEYAVTPTAALVKMGIVNGSGGQLAPAASLSRAEMAKILDMILAA